VFAERFYWAFSVLCSRARVGDRRIIDKARWPKPAGFLFARADKESVYFAATN
jgi:hypothetical protein